MAKPTQYNEKVLEQARAYVRGGFESCGDCVPSIVGLACELGRGRMTLYEWRDRHPEFAEIFNECEDRQHRVALNKGLSGVFNSAITKLLLHNHGYSDKQASEISGPRGGAIEIRNAAELTDEELAAIAAESRD